MMIKQRSDITDLDVCKAYQDKHPSLWPYEVLSETTGACEKVCFRAMERACERGYIDYGVSLRSGWLTDKGKRLIDDNDPGVADREEQE